MPILGLILLVLLGGVTLIALLAALSLLLPIPVERARQKLEKSLGLSFLLGLVNIIFFSAIVGLCIYLAQLTGGGPLASIPILLGGLILAALAVLTLFGLAAMTKLLGERMGTTKSPLWSDMRGGLLLILAGLAPYIGWYVFTPAVVCVSLGAAILALFQRKTVPLLKE
jgi:hypothetical protein